VAPGWPDPHTAALGHSGRHGIALLIGTLGLANIMLITVTERTNEIGIRRAVGARRSAILRHFLFEAVLVAGLGGIIGIGLGLPQPWVRNGSSWI